MKVELNPWIAIGVIASTATTDAVYVLFNAAVMARRPARAASLSSLWYLLSAFAVISYTGIRSTPCSPPPDHGLAPISRCDG